MRFYQDPSRQIPIKKEADVLVVGGGPSGLSAAVAAARSGARVILVERYGYLGGLATGGLVLYMEGVVDKEAKRAIGGIMWETLERLKKVDGLVELRENENPHVDSELLKFISDELCLESSFEVMFHSLAVSVMADANSLAGIVVENKSGRQAIGAKIIVDCTGDGDIAAWAGAPFESGTRKIGLNMKIGGVNLIRKREFERDNPEELKALRSKMFSKGGMHIGTGPTPYSDSGVYWVNISGLAGRKDQSEASLSTINVDDLSFAEIELRRRLKISLDFHRENIPGFEKLHLLALASQLGVRESRRIETTYRLLQSDIEEGKQFDDGIGAVAARVAGGGRYHVPFGSLVPSSLDDLLVAGRCLGSDHWSQNYIRLIPAAFMTGQAAGTAAAMSADKGIEPRDLDTAELRQRLKSENVILV